MNSPISLPHVLGVDLYHGDGDVSFHALAAAGVQFVIAKATQGLHMVDPMYEIYRERAKAMGLLFGAYLFLNPSEDSEAQVDFFLATAKPIPGDLIPTIDSETPSDSLESSTLAACRAIKAEIGRYPFLYSSDSMLQMMPQSCAVSTVWAARYGHLPTTPHAIWQFSESESIAGIPHGLDADVFSGDLAALKVHTL